MASENITPTHKGFGAVIFVAFMALLLLCSFSLGWNIWLGLALGISLSLSWLIGGFLYYQFWGKRHNPDWRGALIGVGVGLFIGGGLGIIFLAPLLLIGDIIVFTIDLLAGLWCGFLFATAGRACESSSSISAPPNTLSLTPVLIIGGLIFGGVLPWLVQWWKRPSSKQGSAWQMGMIGLGIILLSLTICILPSFIGFSSSVLNDETAFSTNATEASATRLATTATPIPTPAITPTPTPLPPGYNRAEPFAHQSVVSGPVWEVEILEDIRGTEATEMALSLNQFNDIPAEGREYILLRVRIKNTASESREITPFEFSATGDNRVRHSATLISGLEPRPEGELASGAEAEGWIAFEVAQAEDNLMLVIDQPTPEGDEISQYLAIDEGAVVPPPNLSDDRETAIGTHENEPAEFGKAVTTSAWQTEVLSVVRGERAWELAQEANQFNEPPPAGQELVLVKARLKYIGSEEGPHYTSPYLFFSLIGNKNIEYDTVSVANLEPELSGTLYPGGEIEGWIALQAGVGETDLKLIFSPDFSNTQKRYLSLEE